MAQLQVPRDYVRKQLHSMGIQDISEGDLESYTRGETQKYSLFGAYRYSSLVSQARPKQPQLVESGLRDYTVSTTPTPHPPFSDFSRLIQERLQHEDSAELSSANSSSASTPAYPPSTNAMHARGHTLQSGMLQVVWRCRIGLPAVSKSGKINLMISVPVLCTL